MSFLCGFAALLFCCRLSREHFCPAPPSPYPATHPPPHLQIAHTWVLTRECATTPHPSSEGSLLSPRREIWQRRKWRALSGRTSRGSSEDRVRALRGGRVFSPPCFRPPFCGWITCGSLINRGNLCTKIIIAYVPDQDNCLRESAQAGG